MGSKEIINIMIIGGTYIGKGAEAMMLVVKDQLMNMFPNARFWAIPINSDEEKKLINDGFKIVHKQTMNYLIKLFYLTVSLLGLKHSNKKNKNYQSGATVKNPFQITDLVIDISGFSSSDQIGVKAAFGRWLTYTWASIANNKIFFMPQSWGPFENRWVRIFTRWTLKKACFICAREKVSYDYLLKSKCAEEKDVRYFNDIAFCFNVSNPEVIGRELINSLGYHDNELPVIAMTPNMRIYERVKGEDANNTYVRMLLEIADYFLKNTNYNILLIPHEDSYKRLNDPELCLLLMNLMKNSNRVAMLTGRESALQVKAIIGISEFLVASRYHSLVAALSMRTPVAVIGWSHKYEELMQLVDLTDFIIDPVRKNEDREVIDVVSNAFRERDMITAKLRDNVPRIENEAVSIFQATATIINRECLK